MSLYRTMQAVGLRGLLLMLCACGGQAALMAPQQVPPASSAQEGAGPGGAGPILTDRTLEAPNQPRLNEFLGINDSGKIVDTAGDGAPEEAYIVYTPYQQRDFRREALPGAVRTTVTALNNAGMIVGFSVDRQGLVSAFAEQNGVWTRYTRPSNLTEFLGVNDAGEKVGVYTDRRGVSHGFELNAKADEFHSLRPPGSVSVTPSGINDGGEIIGYMTTSRRYVESFLSKGSGYTVFSYPGAKQTRALGINQQGQIVGSYVDASGATHGFLLRDATTKPQWRSFDEAKAYALTVLTGINARGDLVGYYRDNSSHTRAFLGLGQAKTLYNALLVPVVIPVAGAGGDPQDTDPGAIPDQHLFGMVIDYSENSSSSLAKNCPGVSTSSTCQPYKYVNFFMNFCDTPITLAAYQWADKDDEAAFLHTYPNGTVASNRMTWLSTPNPEGPLCRPDNPNQFMRMNPSYSFNSYLYKNVWTGSNYLNDFPKPYGVMEDDASALAGVVVGGYGQVSTEYGSGTSPSGFANQLGNSPYHRATDWETALGIFINGACGTTCLSMSLDAVATGSGYIGACSDISGGHCHSPYYSGVIDDQVDFDNVCKTVTGHNLTYLMAERPIFGGRFGLEFMDSQTMTVDINTNANLYSHTVDGCANTKIVDIETSYGEGGLGDINGGHRVRLVALAWRWLVANPLTGIPDRVISYQYTEDGTVTEVPYFFEDTFVPDGAEIAVPKFVWNGKTQTVGGGCPSAEGDTGGAVSLLVQCVGSAGIYCQQYEHLYINESDNGKVAACLNTSTTTEDIPSSWFKHDPISSYKYVLALTGGELTSVPYEGVSGGSIALSTCTNKTYCTGSTQLSSQVGTFKGNGTDTLCGQCGVILLQNE